MSRSLFLSMVKMHGKTVISYGLGMAAYMLLVIWVYPSIAHSTALNTVLHNLPHSMTRLIGAQSGFAQVGDYLAAEFYGFLYVIILAIYTVTASTQLMAHLIDNGSMSYLLATPVSRAAISMTQAVQLVCGIIVIGICATSSALLGVHWFVGAKNGLNVSHFIEMNLVGVLLFILISAYSFFFSCIARDERTTLAMSASLTIIFYALNTIATLSDKFRWMKHLSIFSAFNPQALINGHSNVTRISLAFTAASLVLFGMAVLGFRNRQMSL